jgi:hypothetical protein
MTPDRLIVHDEQGQRVSHVVLTRKQLRHVMMVPVLCLLLLLAIAGVVAFILFEAQEHNQQARRQSAIGFINLLNDAQAQQNLIAAGAYIDYRQRVKTTRELLETDDEATSALQKFRRESIIRSNRLAQSLSYTPMIDVKRALARDRRYQLPRITPFTMRTAEHIIAHRGRITQGR